MGPRYSWLLRQRLLNDIPNFETPQFLRDAVKSQIDYRRCKQCEQLAEQQAAHNRDAEWMPQFRSRARSEGQRQASEEGRHGGHQDWPQAQQAGLENRFFGS